MGFDYSIDEHQALSPILTRRQTPLNVILVQRNHCRAEMAFLFDAAGAYSQSFRDFFSVADMSRFLSVNKMKIT